MARPIKTATSPDYRAKIRTVAQALFAERGFASTTIREIADQTGVTSRLLYHYFPNKEALYLSLLEETVSEVVAQMEDIAASTDSPEEKIRRIAEAFLVHYQAHPQRFLLIQRAILEHSRTAQAFAQRWVSRAFAAVHAVTSEGVEQGLFRPLAPRLLSFTVVTHLQQAMHLRALVGDISPDLSGDHLLAELPELILSLLRADTPSQHKPPRRSSKRTKSSARAEERHVGVPLEE